MSAEPVRVIMFLITITRAASKRVPGSIGATPCERFVCEDEGRANFLAGQVIDRFADDEGEEWVFDYRVEPIEVR